MSAAGPSGTTEEGSVSLIVGVLHMHAAPGDTRPARRQPVACLARGFSPRSELAGGAQASAPTRRVKGSTIKAILPTKARGTRKSRHCRRTPCAPHVPGLTFLLARIPRLQPESPTVRCDPYQPTNFLTPRVRSATDQPTNFRSPQKSNVTTGNFRKNRGSTWSKKFCHLRQGQNEKSNDFSGRKLLTLAPKDGQKREYAVDVHCLSRNV